MFERTRTFLQRLSAGRREPSEDERRRWERFATNRETTIRPNRDDAETINVRIVNVSRGGIRFVAPCPFQEGEMIRVELPATPDRSSAIILACVVYVRAEPLENWSIGCSFSTELNDEDLQSLLLQKPSTANPEKRVWPRIAHCGHAVITETGISASEPQSAPIHNISPSGVALRVARRYQPSMLLQIELHSEAGTAVLLILACVVYLSEIGEGEWLMGCNFIRELEDAEFRKLTLN